MPLSRFRTSSFAPSTLGDLIRAHRMGKRLSQLTLASITGVASPVISNIESGKTRNPGILTLAPLLLALGVDPAKAVAACAAPCARQTTPASVNDLEDFSDE